MIEKTNQVVKKVEISKHTVVFTVGFLLFLTFLYIIRDIIFAFFVGVMIMAILDPLVTRLSLRKIPRGISVLLTYLIVFFLVGISLAALVPQVIEQTTIFFTSIPGYLHDLGFSFVLKDELIQQFFSQITTLPVSAAKFTVSIFSNIISVLSVLVLAFYLLTERQRLEIYIKQYLGEEKTDRLVKTINTAELRLGGWARAELTLMIVVGAANYLGFKILGIPFALPLSIFAGIMEIIPYAGPNIGAIPAVLIGLSISPFMGLAAASVAFLVQQLENYVFVPKIMQHSTGVNPLITLMCLAIGYRLQGIIGVLVSIPIYLTFEVIAAEYLKKGELEKEIIE
jgi:predicted PurR-regulated permease PerM